MNDADEDAPLPGTPRSVSWRDGELYLLDQTRLPTETAIERQRDIQQVWESIRRLAVRGAPAIGVAAAYGLCVGMQPLRKLSAAGFLAALREKADLLNSARPTAVNLRWALQRAQRRVEQCGEPDGERLYQALVAEAEAIHREDRQLCQAIGEHGLPLLSEGMGVLTHCNAGALATTGIGTATAPLYLAHRQGLRFRVFADETRPLMQGARLTAWELNNAGVDVKLITDSMAGAMMAAGEVDLVLVGTDRVAANGDMANKIGTLGVAVLARHFGIPFYVACPYSTIDLEATTGEAIPIEERDAEEVRVIGGARIADSQTPVRNPAFDITPHQLVSGFITERGLLEPPFADKLARREG